MLFYIITQRASLVCKKNPMIYSLPNLLLLEYCKAMDDPAPLGLAAAGRSSAVELILQAAQQIDLDECQWMATAATTSARSSLAVAAACCTTGSPGASLSMAGTSSSIAPGLAGPSSSAAAAEKISSNGKKQPLVAATRHRATRTRAGTDGVLQHQRRYSRSKSCDDSAEEDTDTDSDSDVYAMEDVSNGSGNSASATFTSKLQRRSSPDAELKSKQVHNSNERNRRKKLKESVHRLRNQLTRKTKRATMISVLKAGQQEIKELCLLQDNQEKTLSKLKEEHCYLEWKLKNLLSEHKEKAKIQQHNSMPINGTVFDFQLPRLQAQVDSNSTFPATAGGSSTLNPPFSHIPTHTPLSLNPSLFPAPSLFPLYGMLSSPYAHAQQRAVPVVASTNSHQQCPLPPFHYPPYYTHSSYRSPPLLNSLLQLSPSQLMVNYCPSPSSPPLHPSVIHGGGPGSSMPDLHRSSVVTSAASSSALESSSEEDTEEVNVDSDSDSCAAEPVPRCGSSVSMVVPALCSKDGGTVTRASRPVERISGQTILSGSHDHTRSHSLPRQQHSHDRPRTASDSTLMEMNSLRAQYSVMSSSTGHRINKDCHHITGATAHQEQNFQVGKSVERMTHQSPTPLDTKNNFEQERELIACS